MKNISLHKWTLLSIAGLAACNNHNKKEISEKQLPNIIVILTDDMGYADLACYGATKYATPNLDKMAEDGMRFTDFYVSSPSSAPSRCALLTGCYPARNYTEFLKPKNAIKNITPVAEVNTAGYENLEKQYIDSLIKNVPGAKYARHPSGFQSSEVTMAEILKNTGYKTVMYGKWHQGEAMCDHPIHHGFDEYWGVTASISVRPDFKDPYAFENNIFYPNQALFHNDTILGYNVDLSLLTKQYTEQALRYIEKNKDHPFFMYFSHAMPHMPIGASDAFRGKTERGIYGDVIEEIDWSVGEIIKKLKEQNIDNNTLIVFVSDNGPWLAYGDHAGSALPLREGKGTRFEGGVRIPCIMRWPARISKGSVCSTPAMTIDLLPTFAEISDAKLPKYTIDGKSILKMMINPKADPAQEFYLFYGVGNLPGRSGECEVLGVRKGKWKLLYPQKYISLNGRSGGTNGDAVKMKTMHVDTALFDLTADISETKNIAAENPGIVAELITLAKQYDDSLKKHQRPLRWVLI